MSETIVTLQAEYDALCDRLEAVDAAGHAEGADELAWKNSRDELINMIQEISTILSDLRAREDNQ